MTLQCQVRTQGAFINVECSHVSPKTALTVRSIIALGANLPSASGRPAQTLDAAIDMMIARGLAVERLSSWYASPAWPAGSGPDYVNGAAMIDHSISPSDLLALLHGIETDLGRTRDANPQARWASRPCDLDLICTGAAILPGIAEWHSISSAPPETLRPNLVLPHPLMHTRAFVLVPICEIAPDWVHPVLGTDITSLCARLPRADREEIRRITS